VRDRHRSRAHSIGTRNGRLCERLSVGGNRRPLGRLAMHGRRRSGQAATPLEVSNGQHSQGPRASGNHLIRAARLLIPCTYQACD
jgi:hypothetical protein